MRDTVKHSTKQSAVHQQDSDCVGHIDTAWRRLDKDVDLREERDWHSCQGEAHNSYKPVAQWERDGLYLCDGCQQQAEQTAGALPMPFLLMDDADDSSHGTFETLGEARGAVLYDHLTAWTIYRSGQIVDSHSPSEPAPRLLLGLDDCFAAIEDRGGKVDAFAVDGETHFEVTVNGHGYGPMVETELFWFVKGLIER